MVCRLERSRDLNAELRKSGRRADALAVSQNVQAGAELVARPILVPHDRQTLPVVRQIIESKKIPLGRGEWIDFHDVVGARFQPNQAGDDEVIEPGVKIMLAVIIAVVAFE